MTGRVHIPAESLNREIQSLQKAIQEKSGSFCNWMDSECAKKIQSVASIVLSASESKVLDDKEASAFLDVLNSREFQILAEGPKHFVAIRTFFSRVFNEYFGTTKPKSSWEFAKELKEKTERALLIEKPDIVKVKKFEDLAKEYKADIEQAYRRDLPLIRDGSAKLNGFAKLLKVTGSDIKVDYAIIDKEEALSYEEMCLIKEHLPESLQKKMTDAFLEIDVLRKIAEEIKGEKRVKGPENQDLFSDENDRVIVPQPMWEIGNIGKFLKNIASPLVVIESSEEKAKKEAGYRCAILIQKAIDKVKVNCESEAVEQKSTYLGSEKLKALSEDSLKKLYTPIPWTLLSLPKIEGLGLVDLRTCLESFKTSFGMLAKRKPFAPITLEDEKLERMQQVLPDAFKDKINVIFDSDDWKLCMGEVESSSQ